MIKKKYKVEELLKDKSFQNWVFRANQTDIDFWNSYLITNPDNEEQLEEASMIIKGIPVIEDKLTPNEVERLWENFEDKLDSREKFKISVFEVFAIFLLVIIGLVGLGILIYYIVF